jgi:hypothetical protein
MAAICWDVLWVDNLNPPASNTSTTPQDVLELKAAGWRVMGELPRGTAEAEKQQQMRVERSARVVRRRGGKTTDITRK